MGKEHIHVAFAIFDLDDSGAISLEELRHVLTRGPNAEMAAASGIESMLPDGKTVEQMMEELDIDKEGMVEFHEFEQYLMAEHEKVGKRLLLRDQCHQVRQEESSSGSGRHCEGKRL